MQETASHSDSHYLTLQVAGPDVDPHDVSREFGVAASYSHSKEPSGFGVWVLDSRGRVQSDCLSDHLKWLATQLAGNRERLAALGDAGIARLLVNGSPGTWRADASDGAFAREHVGVSLEFVVFVPGPRQIQVDQVRYQE